MAVAVSIGGGAGVGTGSAFGIFGLLARHTGGWSGGKNNGHLALLRLVKLGKVIDYGALAALPPHFPVGPR
jgi:hypothetical protein